MMITARQHALGAVQPKSLLSTHFAYFLVRGMGDVLFEHGT